MKIPRLSSILQAIIVALLLLCGPGVFTGCKNTQTVQTRAYSTLKQTQILVDKAMNVYGQLCVTGRLSIAQQAQIDQLHAQYREAFRLAAGAARLDYTTVTPANVQYLADLLLELITKL